MKQAYQTIIQFELDTDTGKSRIIKHYTYPLGKGSKEAKAKPKQAFSNVEEEEW